MAKKKYIMRALSVGLSLAMCVGLVVPALAVTYDISLGDVTVTESGSSGWDFETKTQIDSEEKNVTVKQSGSEATTNTIAVGAGVIATITLSGVNIDVSGTGSNATQENDWRGEEGKAAFSISGESSNVTVELDGTNILQSGYWRAGLELNDGASVTIQDKNEVGGSLTATGGSSGMYTNGGAGIGSSGYNYGIERERAGTITIDGSIVTAIGGKSVNNSGGAGIGSGSGGDAGKITIKGGSNVTAIGSEYGAGIGAGYNGMTGDIIIDGSVVTATGGPYAAGIGSSWDGKVCDITIQGKSEVTAKGGVYCVGIGGRHAGNITIQGGSNVKAIGEYATGIGGCDSYLVGETTTGNVTISDDVTLLALASGKWAVDPGNGSSTVTGNVLIGRIDTSTPLYINSIFAVRDKDGNVVREFDVRWEGGNYYFFAIDLPRSGESYTIVQRDKDGNILNYLVYEGDMAVYRNDEDGGPMTQGGLVLKNVGTKYEFQSEDGTKLPSGVTNLLRGYGAGTVKVGREVDVKSEGGKWILVSSEKTDEGGIGEDGKLHDIVYTGTWRWEAYHTHSYTSEITTDPTCKDEGVKTFKCECGDEYTEPVEKSTTHSPWGDWTESKPATCEEKGEETRTCGTCGTVERRDIDKLTTHSAWGEWTETKPATCKEKGEETRTCGTCGEVEHRDIDPNGHDDGEWKVTKEPTYDEAGEKTLFCTVCDSELDKEEIAKLVRPTTPVTGGGFTPAEIEIDDVEVPLAGLFTRADAIGYLWEKSGSPEWELSDFPDVPADHHWAVAIGWAQANGIAMADKDGNFRPDDLVLRSVEDIKLSPEGELEQFLNRYAVYAGIELDEGKLFIALDGEWDEIIMGEDAQIIFDAFFAKLEAALAGQAA